MPRRHVRVDHELFLQLEVLLPEEPTDDLPSQGQFISRDLVLALAEVEERWDELPAVSPDGSLRTLIARGVLVYALSIVGHEQPDRSIVLLRITIQPHPPANIIDPDEHDER